MWVSEGDVWCALSILSWAPGRMHFIAALSPFRSLSMVAHGGQKLCPTEHVPDRKQIFHTSLDNPQMDFFFFLQRNSFVA